VSLHQSSSVLPARRAPADDWPGIWTSARTSSLDPAPPTLARPPAGSRHPASSFPADLYDRVAPGGLVILDKYHLLATCRETAGDFLVDQWIDPPLRDIDRVGVSFRKE
jgi:Macrocin-O-methyltransferase (TylF)